MHSAVVSASGIAMAAFSCPCYRWQGPFSGQQFAYSDLLLACAPTDSSGRPRHAVLSDASTPAGLIRKSCTDLLCSIHLL